MNEKIYPSDLNRRGMGVDQRVDPRRQKRWTTAHLVHAGSTQCHLLSDQRGDPMAHVANQFPQVAECLSLLASLEAPGGVSQNPRYVTRASEQKRSGTNIPRRGVWIVSR